MYEDNIDNLNRLDSPIDELILPVQHYVYATPRCSGIHPLEIVFTHVGLLLMDIVGLGCPLTL